MSRTDKDRPWWVARIQDGKIIEHDHRKGECIEETVETARAYAYGSFGRPGRHRRNCKKYVTIEWTCTKYDPNIASYYGRRRTDWKGHTCWTVLCFCTAQERGLPWSAPLRPHWGCPNPLRVQCIGHSRTYRDDSIPCACDDWPPVPTCEIAEATGHRYRWYSGGIPTAFVRSVYHRPERARERGLDDARRMYNAGEDIEDFDFENRQARSSARWLWW